MDRDIPGMHGTRRLGYTRGEKQNENKKQCSRLLTDIHSAKKLRKIKSYETIVLYTINLPSM